MPDRVPGDMPDRMSEDLPVTKLINIMVGITRSKVFFSPSYLCTANRHLDESGLRNGGFEFRYDLSINQGLPRIWGTNGPTQRRQTYFNISQSIQTHFARFRV